MILVVNASPLIVLSKAGLMDVVLDLATEVIIPEPVAEEVSRVKDPADPAKCWLVRQAHLLKPSAPAQPLLAAWDLGAGETSVISLAQSIPGAIAVLDDLAARRCAQAHGIGIVGTLGILLKAKQRGILPAVKPALDAVVAAGLFISPAHLQEILAKAGEVG